MFTDESTATSPATSAPSMSRRSAEQRIDLATTRVLRHKFPEMTYRGASFSIPQVECVASPDSEGRSTVARVSLLACDVLRGLFHYDVTIRIPFHTREADLSHFGDSTGVDMNVKLVAAHKMAETLQISGALGTDTPTGRTASGARGFVSSCVLGPQGRRGIWIERQRGSMDRTVFGFTTRRMQGGLPFHDEDGVASSSAADAGDRVSPIDGKPLHEVRNSYDLGGAQWLTLT